MKDNRVNSYPEGWMVQCNETNAVRFSDGITVG